MDPRQRRINEILEQFRSGSAEADIDTCSELAAHYFMSGDFSRAARFFGQACDLLPGCADLLNNLAACRLELGEYDEAIRLSTEAAGIDPSLGAAFANRADAYRMTGQLTAAISDYQSALRLQPENPLVLNKAGALLHLTRQYDPARSLLERALREAPDFALARLNLGLLVISTGKPAEAEQLIRQSLDSHQLDQRSRQVASTALAILAEHRRLQGVLEEAVEKQQPSLLIPPIQATPSELRGIDVATLDSLQQLAHACNELNIPNHEFLYQSDCRHLAFLEACANSGIRYDATALAGRLADPSRPLSYHHKDGPRNLADIFQACRDRRQLCLENQLATNGEEWIRYWHMKLMRHQADAYPGQFKCFPNSINAQERIEPVLPEQVSGTLKELFNRLSPSVKQGVPRAVFLWLSLLRIHAFKDGNGRLARFICNWELERCGLHAMLYFPEAGPQIIESLRVSMAANNPHTVMNVIRDVRQQTDQRLAEINQLEANSL